MDGGDAAGWGDDGPPPVAHAGHVLRWLVDGDRAFAAMEAAIDAATRRVCVESYIVRPGVVASRIVAACERAARRGVAVRVLVDALGADGARDAFWTPLQAAGGQVRRFNPLRLLRLSIRNHRKLLVADGRAIVGGFNLSDEYAGDGITRGWHDLGMQVDGALVEVMAADFERMWALARFSPGCLRRLRASALPPAPDPSLQLLVAGPGRRGALVVPTLHRDLRAARHVRVYAAYFLPSRMLRRILRAVARRGLAVVLVPARGDVPVAHHATRHAVRRLAGGGVQVFAYRPQMLHAKVVVADDVVYVGSANPDARSRAINYELMLRLHVPALAAQAAALFAADLRRADRLRPGPAGWLQRLRERWAHLLLARVDPYIARRKLRALR